MTIKLFSAVLTIATLMTGQAAIATNIDPVQQLLETRACQGCNLAGADLRETHLIGADLRDANLTGANLSHANLEGADLTGANLDGAILTETFLTNAVLNEATLNESDLAKAIAHGIEREPDRVTGTAKTLARKN